MSTPVFPLGTAYLPGEIVVLNIFEPRYLDLFHNHCNVREIASRHEFDEPTEESPVLVFKVIA